MASPAALAQRPWPVPGRPWLMAQRWHDLLFAHWPLPIAELRPRIPAGLELDTYAGQAWLGVVPFRMSGVRLRGLPALPYLSAFPELNVRTYVRAGGRSGVYFFSLDAANRLAVQAARRWYHLPYFLAEMRVEQRDVRVHYTSRRTHSGARPAALLAEYGPVGPAMRPLAADSLEHFLTARYCLYAVDRRGTVYRGEIHHRPWPLQPAEAEFAVNTMAAAHGFELPDTQPLLHFARRLDVAIWSPSVLLPA